MIGNTAYSASCLLGVEGLVAQELREMGCENVNVENGRVLFFGDDRILARTLIGSRYSERIGILAGEFCARNFQELFEGVKALPWEKYINKHDEFPVTGSSLNSQLHSVPDCQSIIKKAVVERLKLKYKLSWFSEDGARKRIRFRILKDKVSLVIDASGAGLHKRGYRPASNSAPIKETLAAALVKLSRLRTDGCFIDPFCGSGTLLIEAAALAMNMAPGLDRSFVAESWKDID